MNNKYSNKIKLDSLNFRLSWIILFIFLILLKNGFDMYGDSHIKESADLFPIPYDGTSSHYLPVMIYKYFNMSLVTWIILNLVVIVMFILSFGISVFYNHSSSKYLIVLSLFINSPSVTVVLQQLGHYQTFYIVLSVIFTSISTKKYLFFIGALMVVSSPEYSLISLLLLFLWGKAFSDSRFNQRVKMFFIPALCFSLLNMLVMSSLQVASRIDALRPNFQQSFLSFLGSGYVGIYAGFGSIWILIFLIIRSSILSKKNWNYLVLIIFILVSFYAIMADGTRVFVGLSSILLSPIICKFLEVCKSKTAKEVAVLVWILPNFVSEIGSSYFKVPFEFMHSSYIRKLLDLLG